MADIIKFTGTTFADIPVDQCLEACKGSDAVVIIGERNGEFFMASSFADAGTIFLLIETAKFKILNKEFVTNY